MSAPSPTESIKVPIHVSIHLGASSTSMLIAEAGETPVVLDFLEQPAPIARDIFRRGRVTRSTVERCVDILKNYQETLAEYQAGQEVHLRVVVTNILAEAENREAFLSRIQISCGFLLSTLDDGEMTRLIYLKTQRRLSDVPEMRKGTSLVVHVGPGNTRILLFRDGRIERYSSYRLGSHRSGEMLTDEGELEQDGAQQLRLIREQIRGQIDQIRYDYRKEKISEIVAIGYEIQTIMPSVQGRSGSRLNLAHLQNFMQNLATMSLEERARVCEVDYATAPAVLPAFAINLAIAEAFELKSLLVPQSDFEKGLLMDLPHSGSLSDHFQQEVIHSAELLARRYRADPSHYEYVATLADVLFEKTQELHLLTEHDRLLLRVATILHEVGSYVSPRAHHKHSQYIIMNSELFGLSELDQKIVAAVARYHRQGTPQPAHPLYRDLRLLDRMRVAKLASFLRVADALDRSHSQRIRELQVTIGKRKMVLGLVGISDASLERMGMRSKADLFLDIFGLEVVLNEMPSGS